MGSKDNLKRCECYYHHLDRMIKLIVWLRMLLLYGETVWCHLMSDPTTMSPAGFEPALPKETDLKSVALDHSAKDALFGCQDTLGFFVDKNS